MTDGMIIIVFPDGSSKHFKVSFYGGFTVHEYIKHMAKTEEELEKIARYDYTVWVNGIPRYEFFVLETTLLEITLKIETKMPNPYPVEN